MEPPTCSNPKVRLMRMKLKLLINFIIVFLATSLNAGQCPPLYTFSGSSFEEWLGNSVSAAGDVDKDGYADFIIGAPYAVSDSTTVGKAFVLSGYNGDTLYVFEGAQSGEALGFSVSTAGDVNNDSIPDFIIGAPYYNGIDIRSGRAYVYSGKSGESLYIFEGKSKDANFGWSVSSAGDVNNDGFDDFIIGARWDDAIGYHAGRAYVFSGKNGDTLHIFDANSAGNSFGYDVSNAPDLNGDGYDDLIVGAYYYDAIYGNGGTVYVFSGKTGDTLHVFSAEHSASAFGLSFAPLRDLDNDGISEIIIGAHNTYINDISKGRTFVFSGLTGDTLYIIDGEVTEGSFGRSVSSAGDVNGDSYDDFLIGAYKSAGFPRAAGRAYVFSGLTGDTLLKLNGEHNEDFFGWSVSSAGDVNNDGYGDVIVGAKWSNIGAYHGGSAYVYSPCGIRGDFDRNGTDADVFDLTYLIDDMFRGGPDSPCSLEADINSDGTPSNILDLTYLIDFIFRGGPAPGPCN